jgi:uncharacterized protein YjiK
MIPHIFKIYVFFLFVNGCDTQDMLEHFPYDIRQPDQTFILPNRLKEVSGLTWHKDQLFLVKDEKGIVYTFDLKKGEVIGERQIAGTGDFEGVECVGDQIYIMRSDSRIYHVHINDTSSTDRVKIELDLDDDKNLEGFGYDPGENMFLLSSKKAKTKKSRKLYGLSLDNLDEKPATLFEFDHALLKEAMLKNAQSKTQRFSLEASFVNYSFHPSAVARHPITGEYYILSHPQQQLLILDPSFQIKKLVPLPISLFPQPEGICFDPVGNLYISNEGRSGKGTILYFKSK